MQHLNKRSWPAVQQHERRTAVSLMDEMNAVRLVVMERVEPPLVSAPVEFVAPGTDEFLRLIKWHTARIRDAGRPSRAGEASTKIVESRFRDRDSDRLQEVQIVCLAAPR